jgi:regulator of PEP synthase PpsR (kinase-PPPase family)
MKRHVFMVSDGTGITAEHLGNSLITQFEHISFEKITIPYVDTLEKAIAAVARIQQCFLDTGTKPLLFTTLVNQDIANMLKSAPAHWFDLFNTFLGPLEEALHERSSYTVGKTHGVTNAQLYTHRIAALDYTLTHDDGVKLSGYEAADIVLVGVSRSGKTPTCLYMALHFGLLAANYPFTEEEIAYFVLPKALQPYRKKLFGLTIDPLRLHHIRTERRPASTYASKEQCDKEVREAEALFRQENIPFLNSTRYSIEEIATKIMSMAKITRKF